MLMPKLTRRTNSPPPNRNGMTGMIAPTVKARNEPPAADHGELIPSWSSPSSSRTSVWRATSGSWKMCSANRRASSSGSPLER